MSEVHWLYLIVVILLFVVGVAISFFVGIQKGIDIMSRKWEMEFKERSNNDSLS